MKRLKIIFVILIISFIIGTSSYATSISKESLQRNMTRYLTGEKVAVTQLDNGDEIAVGNVDPEGDPIDLEMLDDRMILKDSTGSIEIFYNITDQNCSFFINREISEDDAPEDLYLSLMAPQMLSICFLSVTDEYDIISELALKYYEERMEQEEIDISEEEEASLNNAKLAKIIVESQKNVNDEVFSYKISGEEFEQEAKYQYTAELTINLDKVTNINGQLEDIQIPQENIIINAIVNNANGADQILPKAGKYIVLPGIIILSIITIVLYMKKKFYEDIK